MIEDRLLHDRACLFVYGTARETIAARLQDNTIDALVTDPPAGIAFMNRSWDGDKGGRNVWITWLAGEISEAFRVLKPGAYGLVWALPRTSHWTQTALEDAGFEVRDVITHLFGTGFPKSLDVSKAIDAKLGAAREVLSERRTGWRGTLGGQGSMGGVGEDVRTVTAPATDDARRAEGFGTALKPAAEFWILVRKPLVGTVAENFLAHGTGGLNVDACRLNEAGKPNGVKASEATVGYEGGFRTVPTGGTGQGRWPSNVVLSHSEACVFQCDGGGCGYPCTHCEGQYGSACDPECPGQRRCVCPEDYRTETRCAADCPVRMLDEQSGDRPSSKGTRKRGKNNIVLGAPTDTPFESYGDKGGASRFFYVAKPSSSERDHGCEALPAKTGAEATDSHFETNARLNSPRTGAGRGGGRRNFHPTVKSQGLMRWLVRLVCPPGGTVLDCFAGSGSTGVAALHEGCEFVGIELDAPDEKTGQRQGYAEILEARIKRALADTTPTTTTEEQAA